MKSKLSPAPVWQRVAVQHHEMIRCTSTNFWYSCLFILRNSTSYSQQFTELSSLRNGVKMYCHQHLRRRWVTGEFLGIVNGIFLNSNFNLRQSLLLSIPNFVKRPSLLSKRLTCS
eukprot:Gregarina_sp_Poly_1__3512@NODE_2021_length_2844_cov_8_574361_g1306_i0_p3_GENE_NODE_2021_length_2844_cov_8_574361_g1306_i0NODE_2021_length_2844_cov_8_574361_g1306_i0_p3_ORF_typecomplete_len115_score9_60LuxQperiplasm/PF09308_10/0_17_NODE_2021_length_2844_cov_8_574361_g1306_i0546890